MTHRLLLAAAAALLLAPASASAATVTVREDPDADNDEVHYVAGPGEANRVLVAYAGDARSVTVTDPGAVIAAVAPCVALDAHTARCTKRPENTTEWLQATRVELGDGDDEVRTTRPGPAPIGGVVAFGGAGNDRLDGGAGSDALDGGGGVDVLLGGDGFDRLSDGDVDRAAGPDMLDGGPQHDLVSYAHRSARVSVTLEDDAGGAAGEGDVLRSVESATGGAGDDRLRGDSGLNDLHGRAGDDVLIGLGGEDQDLFGDSLRGGSGDDRLRGGADRDDIRGERGTDTLLCGGGEDIVGEPTRGERLPRACEEILYSFGLAREDSLLFPPHPRATTRTSARFALGCPRREILDGEASACRGTLTLREATGKRRLIGRGPIAGRLGHERSRVRVTFTALGRQLARRPAGVDVTARIKGRGIPTRSWTVPLRAR